MTQKYKFHIISLVLTILVTSILYLFNFYYLESLISDARFRIRPNKNVSNQYVLVAIDQKTIQQLKPAFNLESFNKLLALLADKNPDFIFTLISPETLPRASSKSIDEFKKLSQRQPLIIALDDAVLKGEEFRLTLPPEYGDLKKTEAVISFDKLNFAGDGVARRAFISYYSGFFAQPLIASHYNKVTPVEQYQGMFPHIDANQIYINYNKSGFDNTFS